MGRDTVKTELMLLQSRMVDRGPKTWLDPSATSLNPGRAFHERQHSTNALFGVHGDEASIHLSKLAVLHAGAEVHALLWGTY
jgi:hypothetical protein